MSQLSVLITKIFSAKNCCPCFCLEYLVMFRMVMCNSINLEILVHCIQMVAPPLLEFLTLLTAMHVCLERPRQGENPQRGQIKWHETKLLPDHPSSFSHIVWWATVLIIRFGKKIPPWIAVYDLLPHLILYYSDRKPENQYGGL